MTEANHGMPCRARVRLVPSHSTTNSSTPIMMSTMTTKTTASTPMRATMRAAKTRAAGVQVRARARAVRRRRVDSIDRFDRFDRFDRIESNRSDPNDRVYSDTCRI
jgi:hypothetical protein